MAVETTATFRSLIETRAAQYPPPGPPSGSRQPGSSIHKRKPSVDVHPVGGWVDGRQAAAATEPARPKRAEDAFLKEAYQIVSNSLVEAIGRGTFPLTSLASHSTITSGRSGRSWQRSGASISP